MSKIYKAFQENEASIRRIVAKYRWRKEDVDDLTQETFLKSFAAEIKQEILNPKAFLFRVAKNVAISEVKKKRHSTTDFVEDLGGMEVYKDERHISAEDQLDARQKLFVFSQALATLPPECSRALIMRKIDGLKFKQIALRLDVSVSTIEKRVATALLRCNAYLKKNGYDPEDFGAVSKKRSHQNAGRMDASKDE
ncbi:MAG: RNA polymerase subunit sigma-24 [Robiginitomaculum sp.]|nr:MAG: RNA polymerase subunit sigma-24 [Robiginitomaculum sp.]